MSVRYILAPQAARDLVSIRRHLRQEAGQPTADRVAAELRRGFEYLAQYPGAGHRREDLTAAPVRFLSVYSYAIVYLPELPIQIVAIVHGKRDLQALLTRHSKL